MQLEGYTDPIPLDLDPDVRLAILLSDELGLDEIECVRLLIGAQDLGDLSAERAAGLWYEARHDELSCLIKALQAECLGQSFQDSWGRFPDASVSEALVRDACLGPP